jgi:hypothetical protein
MEAGLAVGCIPGPINAGVQQPGDDVSWTHDGASV